VDDEAVARDGDQIGEGAAGVRAGQDDPGRQDAAEAGVEPVLDFDSDFDPDLDSDFDSDLLSLLDDARSTTRRRRVTALLPFFFPSLPARGVVGDVPAVPLSWKLVFEISRRTFRGRSGTS
jgi:hypothetical protein